MSWWYTGQGDDLTGDVPADMINDALKALAKICADEGQQKPDLAELLTAIKLVANAQSEVTIANGTGSSIQCLTAKLAGDEGEVSSEDNIAPRRALLDVLNQTFEEIIAYYRSALEREPRLSELLACIQFILGYEPETYLSIQPGCSILRIDFELKS